MKFGILRELKSPPDRRVVFAPETLQKAQQQLPSATFVVQSSDIRVFEDKEYRDAGFEVVEDLSNCDVLIGVKEVPIAALIPDKKYFFFSHTIKEQPYNRSLLQTILKKNIEFFDHETLVDINGNRLLGFGYYAGIVGAYNAIRTLGLQNKEFELPKAESLRDKKTLLAGLDSINIPPIKIVLTGKGRVGSGAKEILEYLGVKEVSVADFLDKEYPKAVYVQLDALDYTVRKDREEASMAHFFANPEMYDSNFMRFASVSTLFIAGHFYGQGAPYIFTKDDAKSRACSIRIVADISCDIGGPIASTIRASTIADPVYGYDPDTESEVPFGTPGSIAVMAVDNLPCELPRDASQSFGATFLDKVLPAFFNNDQEKILERARMTKDGKLMPRFTYLQNYVNMYNAV